MWKGIDMLWKIFAVVLVLLLTSYHVAVGVPNVWEAVHLAIDVIGILGILGYSWEKRILRRVFWKWFLPVFCVWMGVYILLLPEPAALAEIEVPEWYSNFGVVLSGGINLLWILGLFLYAFRAEDVWD